MLASRLRNFSARDETVGDFESVVDVAAVGVFESVGRAVAGLLGGLVSHAKIRNTVLVNNHQQDDHGMRILLSSVLVLICLTSCVVMVIVVGMVFSHGCPEGPNWYLGEGFC